MLLSRNQELKVLEDIYDSLEFTVVLLYGRQRVGKTYLAAEFIEGKQAVYFPASETGLRDNMEILSRSAAAVRAGGDVYGGLGEAMRELGAAAQNQRPVLVVDDCDTLKGTGILEQLTKLRDELRTSRLMILLITSRNAFADEFVDKAAKAAITVRTLELKALGYLSVREELEGYSAEDAAMVWAVTGGVPGYLSLFAGRTLRDAVTELFLERGGRLLEEAENILRREVREPALYSATLRAIALGCVKNSQVTERVDLPSSASTAYLKKLMSFGLVRKETPFPESNAKRTEYSISDGLFRFRYSLLPDVMELIMRGDSVKAYEVVSSEFDGFMEPAFREICREWLNRENERGELFKVSDGGGEVKALTDIDRFRQWMMQEEVVEVKQQPSEIEIGRWWDNANRLDLIAARGADEAVLAQCRWSKHDTMEVLRKMSKLTGQFAYGRMRLFVFVNGKNSSMAAQELPGAVIVRFQDM